MANAWKCKINGVSYSVTIDSDGNKIYDPPLPESEQKRGERNMREILRTRQVPSAKTDDTFFAGRGTLADQFKTDPQYLQEIVAGAKADGYTPNPNDVYLPSLARKKGDKRAFVSRAEGTSKIKKICQQEGYACEGSISVQGRKE